MLKRIVILLAACLLSYMSVSAQEMTPDCSSGALSGSLMSAYLTAEVQLLTGANPQTVLADLQSKLAEIQAACAGAATASPETGKSGLDDYSDIPQERLEDGGFVLGYPDAPVTIVEFLDYGCPHCQYYQPTIRDFINQYVRTGKAKFEARILPTRGGTTTQFIGNVVACLEDQRPGAFWAAQEILYEMAGQGKYSEKTAGAVTGRLGLDYGEALQCSIEQNQVTKDLLLANSVDVHSTPTVMVRYDGGEPKFITYQGTTYDGGGPPIEAIAAAISGDTMNT